MSDFEETSKIKWGSRKPIRYKKGQDELLLAGKYGQIWYWGKDFYAAVVTAPRIANKLGPRYGKRNDYSKGEELIIKFPAAHLNVIIKELKIPKSPKTQIRYAEVFPDTDLVNEA